MNPHSPLGRRIVIDLIVVFLILGIVAFLVLTLIAGNEIYIWLLRRKSKK